MFTCVDVSANLLSLVEDAEEAQPIFRAGLNLYYLDN